MRGKNVLPLLLVSLALLISLASAARSQDLGDLLQIKKGRSRAITSSDPNLNSNADRIKIIAPGRPKYWLISRGPGSSVTFG